jgi:hypothetical protein
MNAFKMNKNTKNGKSSGAVHQSTKSGISYMNGTSPASAKTLNPFYSMGPVLSLKGLIQPKLTIGQPNDKYEQEADRVADQVMRMPEPKKSLVQRQEEVPDEEEEEPVQTKPISDQITPLVQRQEGEEEEEEETPIQTKPLFGKPSRVTPGLHSRLQSIKSGGQPLPKSLRNFFEPRFGADFSGVRVHMDSKAAETAKSINSKAFTTGKDVVFNTGQYSPHTHTGKSLIAHELTHVVQQRSKASGACPRLQRAVRFRVKKDDFSVLSNLDLQVIDSENKFRFYHASFSADAAIDAIGDSREELKDWDVGFLQEMVLNWSRIYWLRKNTDGKGWFVEQKYKPINKHFRDQMEGTKTVWVYDTAHKQLDGSSRTPQGKFKVSADVDMTDDPRDEDTIDGSRVHGMNASDGTRNLRVISEGCRFNTYISAYNKKKRKWRHLKFFNWNYQSMATFTGVFGRTLRKVKEKCKVGKIGPYSPGRKKPLLKGTTAINYQ